MKLFEKKKEKIIDYDEIREEELKLISVKIKDARISKNIDKDIISNQLHIPLRIINAIELGDLQNLPEPVFTKQLIKKYADFLKLDGEEIVNNFTTELSPKIYNKNFLNSSFKLNFHINIKPQHLYFLYLLLLFFAVKSLSSILESSQFSQTKIPQKQIIETNIPPTNNPPVKTNPEVIPIAEKKEEKLSTPMELVVKVKVKEDSWVKISVDGKPTFEGILTKGLEKQWNGKQKITIRAGNAGGLLVSVNDEKPKELGKTGQVINTTFELPMRS